MKIKGSSEKINGGHLIALFTVLLIALGALRGIIVSFYIDNETGFYTKDSALITVFNIVLVLSFSIPVLSFFSKETNSVTIGECNDKAVGFSFGAFAFSFLIDALQSVSALSNVSGSSVQSAESMMAAGVFAGVFRGLFAILSFVYFLSVSKSYLKGNADFSKKRILALSPVVWAGSRMIGLFVKQISFVNVSDLLIELIVLSCMIIFFMAFAQVASGVYSEVAAWRIFGFGLVGALISVVLHLSKIPNLILHPQSALAEEYPVVICDIVFGILMFIFALKTFGTKAIKSKNEGE